MTKHTSGDTLTEALGYAFSKIGKINGINQYIEHIMNYGDVTLNSQGYVSFSNIGGLPDNIDANDVAFSTIYAYNNITPAGSIATWSHPSGDGGICGDANAVITQLRIKFFVKNPAFTDTSEMSAKIAELEAKSLKTFYTNSFTDLNEVPFNSIYIVSNASNTHDNFPTGAYNWGILITLGFSDSYKNQMYFPHSVQSSQLNSTTHPCVYTRQSWGGTWSKWKEIISDNVLN